jgi:hypothetical protein
MLISFERTSKNRVKPGQERMGYAPVLSYCSLLRNPLTRPTGVLEHCHAGETNWWFSISSGRFLLPTSPRRRRMSMYSSLFIVVTSHVLYLRYPGNIEASTYTQVSSVRTWSFYLSCTQRHALSVLGRCSTKGKPTNFLINVSEVSNHQQKILP